MRFENKYRYPEGLKCPQCDNDCITEHDVDEVGGQAVGPYTIRGCEECGYEYVVEETENE